MWPALGLALGTLASEDLTCITAGLLIQRGDLSVGQAIAGCALGIFAGDLGLWASGRIAGRVALEWPAVASRLERGQARRFRELLEQHAAGAIVSSRFLPGTRLPLYVTAGVVKLPVRVFALWSLVAVLLWTPTIVLFTASFGDAFMMRLWPAVGPGWMPRLITAAAVLVLLQTARTLGSPSARARAAARLARLRRWEFWPMWLFYPPVALWILWLSVRHRGPTTMTAANPGMPDGGTVGESKAAILRQLPAEWTVPFALVPAGGLAARVREIGEGMRRGGWDFPVVLKPDVGQRGAGVRLAWTTADVERYVSRQVGPVIVQPYHEGPFEAGVFYYRMPGSPRGRIFSITDKHFPSVVGDGESTVEELIWRHPRYRLQAHTFLERHREILHRVLEPGERLRLAVAGNHCQGTLFRDGRHLITPALEARIDAIAQAYPGFFVGRFDIRYRSVDAFMAGRDLAIVELNGATSESTNIYDPDSRLIDAYRQLFRQWSIVFAIGAANRRHGARASSARRLAALVRTYLRTPIVFPISD